MAAADARYALVRDQLYQLGFEQPMPLGSLALVSTLLEDLVKTTGNLKRFDEENQQLKKVGTGRSTVYTNMLTSNAIFAILFTC